MEINIFEIIIKLNILVSFIYLNFCLFDNFLNFLFTVHPDKSVILFWPFVSRLPFKGHANSAMTLPSTSRRFREMLRMPLLFTPPEVDGTASPHSLRPFATELILKPPE
jgi:hypothetical protein